MGKSLKKVEDRCFSITIDRFIIKYIITVKNKIVIKPSKYMRGIYSEFFRFNLHPFALHSK